MSELIDIDELIKKCGYSFCGKRNNGYCCNHPKNTEAPGRCHTFACPIVREADYNDILELDPELAKQYKSQYERMGFIDSDWVVTGKKKEKAGGEK